MYHWRPIPEALFLRLRAPALVVRRRLRLSFLLFSLMVLPADEFKVDLGLGCLDVHLLEGGGDDLRDGEIAKPLVIGGDDVPGSVVGAGLAKDGFIGANVVVPEFALAVVVFADLPVAGGIVEAFFEALELLFWADVEKEFEDARVVLMPQQLFEFVDGAVALRPDALRDEVVHAHHQHVFVVRAVEDGDLAAVGGMRMNSPEEV